MCNVWRGSGILLPRRWHIHGWRVVSERLLLRWRFSGSHCIELRHRRHPELGLCSAGGLYVCCRDVHYRELCGGLLLYGRNRPTALPCRDVCELGGVYLCRGVHFLHRGDGVLLPSCFNCCSGSPVSDRILMRWCRGRCGSLHLHGGVHVPSGHIGCRDGVYWELRHRLRRRILLRREHARPWMPRRNV